MRITDLLGHEWRVDCIGCAIGSAAMTPPGGIIAENDTFTMHQDPLVPLEGFLVVASRRHVRSLADLTPEEHADCGSLLRLGRQLLRPLEEARAFSIIQEEASSHLHVWLFPWLPWVVDRYGDTSLCHVRPAMEEAIRTLSTTEQRAKVLAWVEQARERAAMSGLVRQRLGLATIVVRDYDEAIGFYTEVLRFDLVEDTFLPDEQKRWVVVSPPGAQESRLLLARAADPEQASHVGNQTGGRVSFFLYTDDFWRDYAGYRERGVVFVREPRDEVYGTVAVFQDLYGNRWDLLEPAGSAPGRARRSRAG